jgi:gamma-glutamyltranspeptidase
MPAAICAPQPDAVDAGATILRNGGNAIDPRTVGWAATRWSICIWPG